MWVDCVSLDQENQNQKWRNTFEVHKPLLILWVDKTKALLGQKDQGDVRGGILIEVDARRWAGLINGWVCSGTWWYCYDICACLMRTDFRNAFKRTSFSLRLKDALPEISKWYYHDLAPVNNNYCYQGKQLLGYNLTSRSTTACRWQFIEGKGGLPTFNNCLLRTCSGGVTGQVGHQF